MNTDMLYCIRHEHMEKVETFGRRTILHGHWVEIGPWGEPPDYDWCEFDLGFAHCPPPEFDMDAWMETAEENASPDEPRYTFDHSTGQWVDSIYTV